MGYRSTVAIRCQKNAYEMLKKTYEEMNFPPDKVLTAPDDDGQYLSEQYLIIWDWVKWYDCFDYIEAIEKTMDQLDEMRHKSSGREVYDSEYGYRFVRSGEQDGDIEYRDNNDDLELWAEVTINIDDFVKDKNRVVSDEMYGELVKLLDYFDVADADDVSDGELLDMFYGFCKKLKNDIDERR